MVPPGTTPRRRTPRQRGGAASLRRGGWQLLLLLLLLVTCRTTAAASSDSSPHRNHLDRVRLANQFFALRHGQSEANVAHLIASDPSLAIENFGLTPTGFEQARKAGHELLRDFLKAREDCREQSRPVPRGIVVVCSDLKRARETAETVVSVLAGHNKRVDREGTGDLVAFCHERCGLCSKSAASQPTVDARLRERGFGTWDGGSDAHYQDVWKDDAVDPHHTRHGVESVWSVLDRATACVCDWDHKLSPDDASVGPLWVVLVAHGDVLQILQAGFCGLDPSRHRSLEHLATAGLRPLEQPPSGGDDDERS